MTWEPIETAPKDGENILVWESGRRVEMAYWDKYAYTNSSEQQPSGCWYVEECGHITPTHWMPLPEPPAQQDHPTMVSDGAKEEP